MEISIQLNGKNNMIVTTQPYSLDVNDNFTLSAWVNNTAQHFIEPTELVTWTNHKDGLSELRVYELKLIKSEVFK